MSQIVEIRTNEALLHLVALVKAGSEVVLTENQQPVARLVAPTPATPPDRRQAGLHRGAMTMSADFDEPLSEELWTRKI